MATILVFLALGGKSVNRQKTVSIIAHLCAARSLPGGRPAPKEYL
jgi:hypothetical protein